jgi:hypothetical protein
MQETTYAIAAHGLPGCEIALPAKALDARAWTSLMVEVTEQRIVGHLVDAIEDGAMPVTEAQRDEALAQHLEYMAAAMMLDRRLLEVVSLFEAEAIDYRALKGAALATLDYPSPSLRCFGDIDLLVPSERFDDAVAVLLAAGCTRQYPEPRRGFDSRFGKGASFNGPDGFEIDLHRTFVAGPFAQFVDPAELFARYETFAVADRKVKALALEERFLHACFHAALGNAPARLVPLRDVAQFLLSHELDVGTVETLCTRWRGRVVLSHAICTTWSAFELADVVPLSAWAHSYHPTADEQRSMRPYMAGTDYTVRAIAAVRAVHGTTAKASYVRALLFPNRSYIEGRDAGQLRRWRRAARKMLQRRSHA